MNLIETSKKLSKTVEYLKKEFEVIDLDKVKLCFGLELKHKANEILVHQSAYTEMILKHFNINKAHPLNTLWLYGH